jgi:DNA topoisomerase-3
VGKGKGKSACGTRGSGCSNYKIGCNFVIWKKGLSKRLTPTTIKSLIEKWRTNKLKLIDRSGGPNEGRIVLMDRNVGQVTIEPET